MPAVGGYEGVGEVHSVGSAVKGLLPGDLVIPSPPSSGNVYLLCVLDHILRHMSIFGMLFVILLSDNVFDVVLRDVANLCCERSECLVQD